MKNERLNIVLSDIRFPYKVEYFHMKDNLWVELNGFVSQYEALSYIQNLTMKYPGTKLRLFKVLGVVNK